MEIVEKTHVRKDDEKYCQHCGKAISLRAELCPHCGVRQPSLNYKTEEQKKKETEWLTTLLLCIFLGGFGVHRFYTGHIAIGILQVLTLGGCGIWSLIDLILIIVGNFKDADGNPIKQN